jgi:hypothetical protein
MAGSGYKLYATGDILTAAQVNNYLQEQTVMVFADASARTTALASVLAEGMISYLKDTDVTQYYSGSAWVTIGGTASPLTTKGDLYGYSTTNARIAVGTNGQVLTADSTAATGVAWATAAGSSGPAFQAYSTPTQSVSSTTNTKATMTNEAYDTDNCFASSRFTPTKAGYYMITGSISFTGAATKTYRVLLYKNGSNYGTWNSMSIGPSVANPTLDNTVLMYLNGSTDYCELYGWTDATSPEFYQSTFQGVWIRS